MLRGTIVAGTLREDFESSLSWWSAPSYKRHWREAILRLILGSASTAIITNCTDPHSSNFITWWPGYRIGSDAVFQQQILFVDDLSGSFDPSSPFGHVAERESETEDGIPISEWRVPLDDLADYLSRTTT